MGGIDNNSKYALFNSAIRKLRNGVELAPQKLDIKLWGAVQGVYRSLLFYYVKDVDDDAILSSIDERMGLR